MKRITSYPKGHWSLAVDIPYSMGVKQNELVFLCGQADMKGKGTVCHSSDLLMQTDAAIEHIRHLFLDLGSHIEKLVKLTVFYVDRGDVDQAKYKSYIAESLKTQNAPVVAMVPIPHFFYPDMMVEIDAVGIDADAPRHYLSNAKYGPGTEGLSQALRCGEYIFLGGTSALEANGSISSVGDSIAQTRTTLQRIESILNEFGADRRDLVKLNNWFVNDGTAGDWALGGKVRTGFFPEPGPVATGHPLHTLGVDGLMFSSDCWAMLGESGERLEKQHVWPKGHWDWPIHLPFKHGLKCRDVIFLGGQVSLDENANVVHPHDMVKQTHVSMENVGKVLAEFGAGYSDILKLNTWYKGADSAEGQASALHQNVQVRSSYFQSPGPASTGIPLNYLCFENMLNETEVIAWLESDSGLMVN
ncbi:MAG: hypothetical protein GKR96_08480 [Gammaproteobacteria bacterium]|nr:hypothetical protein [Gammaproteobacteria bacterium]